MAHVRRPLGPALVTSLLPLVLLLAARPLTAQPPAPVALAGAVTEVTPPDPPARPRYRLHYSNLAVVRGNPIGLQDFAKLGLHRRLGDSQHALLRDNFVGVSLQPFLTPAFVRLGAGAELQPVALLHLEARVDWLSYLGTFGHLRSFPGYGADYSGTAIDAGAEQAYATSGWQATLAAELRAKVGEVVIRSKAQATRTALNVHAGDTVWYDPFLDVLAPARGWTLTNDADLLWLRGPLVVGLRHTWTGVEDPTGAAGKTGDASTSRLGPLIAYSLFERPGATFDKPTVLLLVQWHLQHRFRTGLDTPAALPYLALGFAFKGDVLSGGL